MKGIQIYSIELRPHTFEWGDNSEITKIHLQHLKILLSPSLYLFENICMLSQKN